MKQNEQQAGCGMGETGYQPIDANLRLGSAPALGRSPTRPRVGHVGRITSKRFLYKKDSVRPLWPFASTFVARARRRAPEAGALPNRSAFTLIELLVVIAIIAILAALIAGLAAGAAKKRKEARIQAEKEALITAIEAYHAKLGFYPPDNAYIATFASKISPTTDPIGAITDNPARTNRLLYELTGCLYDSANTQYTNSITTNLTILYTNIFANYGKGIANAVEYPDVPYRAYSVQIKSDQYASYNDANTNICGMTVPADLVAGQPNFWFYDASSTNRHNPESYDLWAVYMVGTNITTNCNWIQQ